VRTLHRGADARATPEIIVLVLAEPDEAVLGLAPAAVPEQEDDERQEAEQAEDDAERKRERRGLADGRRVGAGTGAVTVSGTPS
jgi:hypothetical protein